jgi:hypothetical protein
MPRIALIAAALLLAAAPAFAQSGDEVSRTMEQNRRAVLTAPPAAAAPAQQASGALPAARPPIGRPATSHPAVVRPTGLALAQEASAALAR